MAERRLKACPAAKAPALLNPAQELDQRCSRRGHKRERAGRYSSELSRRDRQMSPSRGRAPDRKPLPERQSSAGFAEGFEPRRDIDAVAHQVPVGLLDDVAEVDPNPKLDADPLAILRCVRPWRSALRWRSAPRQRRCGTRDARRRCASRRVHDGWRSSGR